MADLDGDDFGAATVGWADSDVVNVTLTRADIIAADLVWLQFSTPMVRNAALLEKTNYTITGPGASGVFAVSSGDNMDSKVSEVYLVASGFQIGEEYTITVAGPLVSAAGSVLKPNQAAKFIARRTSVDAVIAALPRAYNTIPGSRIRGLINAIGRQIDLTKGSRRDYLP